jgi:diaminopimelate epimerase
MEPRPSIIVNAIENNLSVIPDIMNAVMSKTENICFDGQQKYCSSESVEFVVSF